MALGTNDILASAYFEARTAQAMALLFKIEDWKSGINYKTSKIVIYDNNFYKCITDHTSNIFQNDSLKWQRVGGSIDPDLSNFYKEVTVTDEKNNPTTITYTRSAPESTLYMTRVHSNPDINGFYQTTVETFKALDGVTTEKTYTYNRTFFEDGKVRTESPRVVS